MNQLLVRGGRCASGGKEFRADILVNAGRITAVGPDLPVQARQVIDASGLLVLPGGVDAHVHLPWPTGSHISTDTFASGTRAAAFGGVTTVLDFCIPDETQSLSSTLERKLAEARQEAWVDYSFHLNIRGDILPKLAEIPVLAAAGFPSFKVFMAYAGFRLEDADLLKVLGAVGSAGGVVSAHAEDGPLADAATADLLSRGLRAPAYFAQARPPACEEEAIRRILQYQAQTGCRLHIHHVSTAAGAAAIGQARQAGRPVSGETCPQYLLFSAEDYAGDPARAAALVCAPSIKNLADQAALWQALAEEDGLSVLATDHCPYSRAQKEANLADFSQIPGGMAGVETRLALGYSAGVAGGRLSLARFAQVWAEGPARAFGLYPRKGIIAAGSDADLVLVDPAAQSILRAADLHMNTDCLAYEGMQVTGKPVATILGGRLIVQNGRQLAEPAGQLVFRRF